MTNMRTNAAQLLRENYQGVEDKEAMSLREWVEVESEANPNFFYWLFPDAENITGDFGEGLTEKEMSEFNDLLDLLDEL